MAKKREVWILIHPDGKKYELSRKDIEMIVESIEKGPPVWPLDKDRLLRKMGLRHMCSGFLDVVIWNMDDDIVPPKLKEQLATAKIGEM